MTLKHRSYYSRRVGRKLSNYSQQVLIHELPKLTFAQAAFPIQQDVFLEIGIGMGEHLIYQAQQNPQGLFIGAEVYITGIAKAVKAILDKNITNILLWPDDIDLLLGQLPLGSLSGIYVLFPDPWPKTKHHKRRILNEERLQIFSALLKPNGFIIISTDIDSYYSFVKYIAEQMSVYNMSISDTPMHDYLPTRYHAKALLSKRSVKFIRLNKN